MGVQVYHHNEQNRRFGSLLNQRHSVGTVGFPKLRTGGTVLLNFTGVPCCMWIRRHAIAAYNVPHLHAVPRALGCATHLFCRPFARPVSVLFCAMTNTCSIVLFKFPRVRLSCQTTLCLRPKTHKISYIHTCEICIAVIEKWPHPPQYVLSIELPNTSFIFGSCLASNSYNICDHLSILNIPCGNCPTSSPTYSKPRAPPVGNLVEAS